MQGRFLSDGVQLQKSPQQFIKMKTDYERQRDRETRRVLELARTRQEIEEKRYSGHPILNYFLGKRKDALEEELHTGRHSVN